MCRSSIQLILTMFVVWRYTVWLWMPKKKCLTRVVVVWPGWWSVWPGWWYVGQSQMLWGRLPQTISMLAVISCYAIIFVFVEGFSRGVAPDLFPPCFCPGFFERFHPWFVSPLFCPGFVERCRPCWSRLGSDWMFLLVLGIIMALISFVLDLAIDKLQSGELTLLTAAVGPMWNHLHLKERWRELCFFAFLNWRFFLCHWLHITSTLFLILLFLTKLYNVWLKQTSCSRQIL